MISLEVASVERREHWPCPIDFDAKKMNSNDWRNRENLFAKVAAKASLFKYPSLPSCFAAHSGPESRKRGQNYFSVISTLKIIVW